MNLAIAVPTYNEAENIQKLVQAIHESLKTYPKLNLTVFVIDDNSPDGTAAIASKLGASYKKPGFSVTVIRRQKKEGLGKAYIDAFHQIIKQNKFDFILQMDADLSHEPKYLPAFLDATKQADFVVGSRYIRGGGTPDWALLRKFLSHGGNIYTRLFLGSKVTDYTGGYNLFSVDLLKKIDLDSLQAGGYGFLIELKYRAIQNCHGIRQIPIIFMDRQYGISKIPRDTLIANLILVPTLRFGHRP
jgi:dolichol-phosphate mannosyltransferase